MKPTTRKSIFQKQNDSIEEVKNYLKNFSKLLRRDFLAILVKMCAKALQIRTVREDWRTRTGMLQFMQQNWPKFLVLVNTETCIKWFCSNFEQFEKILSNRKFSLFLYSSWEQYKSFLMSKEGCSFMKQNQNQICNYLEGQTTDNNEWMETELGQQVVSMIKKFKVTPATTTNFISLIPSKPNITTTSTTAKPMIQSSYYPQNQHQYIQQETTVTEPQIIFQPEVEITSASEFDDIEIEDSFDPIPFEYDIHLFDQQIAPTFEDIPLLYDDYQL